MQTDKWKAMQVVFTMKMGFMSVEPHLQSSNDAGRSDCTDRRCMCVHVCVCVCVRVSDKPGWCMARDRGVCTALNGPVVRWHCCTFTKEAFKVCTIQLGWHCQRWTPSCWLRRNGKFRTCQSTSETRYREVYRERSWIIPVFSFLACFLLKSRWKESRRNICYLPSHFTFPALVTPYLLA